MLAARAHEGETELRLEETETPEVGPGEVLIEVVSAGLAPGMFELWIRGMLPLLPQTLGHEVAGTIAAAAPDVTEFAPGDRVRLHPNLRCRRCQFCLTDREQLCRACAMIGHGSFGPAAAPLYERYHDGGLAEYVLAPAWTVDLLPDPISFDVGAKVHDVANALRAWKVAAPPLGATVVWTAATGTVGTSAVRLAKRFGVGRMILIGRSRDRLTQVEALDSELVDFIALEDLDGDWGDSEGLTRAIRDLVPEGPDVAVDFSPEGPTTWQAIASLKPGGAAVVMGSNVATPPLPTMAMVLNCWRVQGTRNCTREDARQVMQWLEAGEIEIEDLVTHRFGLADIGAATAHVRERPEPSWMTVVHPGQA